MTKRLKGISKLMFLLVGLVILTDHAVADVQTTQTIFGPYPTTCIYPHDEATFIVNTVRGEDPVAINQPPGFQQIRFRFPNDFYALSGSGMNYNCSASSWIEIENGGPIQVQGVICNSIQDVYPGESSWIVFKGKPGTSGFNKRVSTYAYDYEGFVIKKSTPVEKYFNICYQFGF